MRKKIIAGNWKMNKTRDEAVALATLVRDRLGDQSQVEVVLCPSFTNLDAVYQVIRSSPIALGAQNLYWEPSGAFTGEVSVEMLKSVGCSYVIIGHSERRQYFLESDETVNKKTKQALQNGLVPIVCVGETLNQRKSDETEKVLERQITMGVGDLSADQIERVIIAYEPVWAIGTGVVATPQQAQSAHKFIRNLLSGIFSMNLANALRIQYGGSMKPDNAAELLRQTDIDGGLIGGASLDAQSFLGIIEAC